MFFYVFQVVVLIFISRQFNDDSVVGVHLKDGLFIAVGTGLLYVHISLDLSATNEIFTLSKLCCSCDYGTRFRSRVFTFYSCNLFLTKENALAYKCAIEKTAVYALAYLYSVTILKFEGTCMWAMWHCS